MMKVNHKTLLTPLEMSLYVIKTVETLIQHTQRSNDEIVALIHKSGVEKSLAQHLVMLTERAFVCVFTNADQPEKDDPSLTQIPQGKEIYQHAYSLAQIFARKSPKDLAKIATKNLQLQPVA